jgi:hypothetical protein
MRLLCLLSLLFMGCATQRPLTATERAQRVLKNADWVHHFPELGARDADRK